MAYINLNDEFKDRGLKIIIRVLAIIVLLILITLAIITFSKVKIGEHVKFLGFEFNIPKEHPDTVIKIVYAKPHSDSIPKQDLNGFKRTKSLPKVKSTDTNKRATIKAKNVLNGNVSGGTVQVGDSYNGIKQRHFTPDEIKDILNQLNAISSQHPEWPKDFPILIFYKGQDAESLNYVNELAGYLNKNGHSNLSPAPGFSTTFSGTNGKDYFVGKGGAPTNYFPVIGLDPAKNVGN